MLSRFFALVAIVVLSAPALAQEIDTRHYIYIEATGKVSAPPDHASIAVSLSHKGASPQIAVDASVAAVNKLLEVLTGLGIPEGRYRDKQFRLRDGLHQGAGRR